MSSFFLPVADGGSGIRKTRARFEELWNQLAKDERSSIQWGVGAKEVCFFLDYYKKQSTNYMVQTLGSPYSCFFEE